MLGMGLDKPDPVSGEPQSACRAAPQVLAESPEWSRGE